MPNSDDIIEFIRDRDWLYIPIVLVLLVLGAIQNFFIKIYKLLIEYISRIYKSISLLLGKKIFFKSAFIILVILSLLDGTIKILNINGGVNLLFIFIYFLIAICCGLLSFLLSMGSVSRAYIGGGDSWSRYYYLSNAKSVESLKDLNWFPANSIEFIASILLLLPIAIGDISYFGTSFFILLPMMFGAFMGIHGTQSDVDLYTSLYSYHVKIPKILKPSAIKSWIYNIIGGISFGAAFSFISNPLSGIIGLLFVRRLKVGVSALITVLIITSVLPNSVENISFGNKEVFFRPNPLSGVWSLNETMKPIEGFALKPQNLSLWTLTNKYLPKDNGISYVTYFGILLCAALLMLVATKRQKRQYNGYSKQVPASGPLTIACDYCLVFSFILISSPVIIFGSLIFLMLPISMITFSMFLKESTKICKILVISSIVLLLITYINFFDKLIIICIFMLLWFLLLLKLRVVLCKRELHIYSIVGERYFGDPEPFRAPIQDIGDNRY